MMHSCLFLTSQCAPSLAVHNTCWQHVWVMKRAVNKEHWGHLGSPAQKPQRSPVQGQSELAWWCMWKRPCSGCRAVCYSGERGYISNGRLDAGTRRRMDTTESYQLGGGSWDPVTFVVCRRVWRDCVGQKICTSAQRWGESAMARVVYLSQGSLRCI